MSKTFNSVTFDLNSQEKDVVTFRDFATNAASVAYKRSAPKRTKDFPGMEKGEVKHTLLDPVLGTIGIVTVTTSIRAGTPDVIKTALAATIASIISDAAFTNLVIDQRLPLNG